MNISLVKNLKPDEIVRSIEFARFTGTLADVWIGAARGWRGGIEGGVLLLIHQADGSAVQSAANGSRVQCS